MQNIWKLHRKILHTMRSFAWYSKFLHGCILVSHGVRNLAQGAKFLSLIPTLYPAAIEAPLDFICYVKILHSHAKLLDVRFLLLFSSLHTWLACQRLQSAPKLGFFMCLSFNLLCHGLHKILPHSWLVLMIKKAIKTPKLNTIWLELIARVLNMLIGLKGVNYYSKVFKRVDNKL